jgi:putative Ig domain-containing protein
MQAQPRLERWRALFIVLTVVAATSHEARAQQPLDLPEATAGAHYQFQIPTEGGLPPLKLKLTKGSLPPGIKLYSNDQGAVLEGTPKHGRGSIYQFTIEVFDSSSPRQRSAQQYRLSMHAGPPHPIPALRFVMPVPPVPNDPQTGFPSQVPVSLLVDHEVGPNGNVLFSRQFPVAVAVGRDAKDGNDEERVAPAGTFLYCKVGAKGKNSLTLVECRMLFQSVSDDKTYECNVRGATANTLTLVWLPLHWWEHFGNASETMQAALAGFAAGSVAALFTAKHWIEAVSAGYAGIVAGVGPYSKHHPKLLLPAGHIAIPENRALLLDLGRGHSSLMIDGLKYVKVDGFKCEGWKCQ